MKNEHIINLLEERPARNLDERERAIIEAHTAVCSDCLHAYRAARVSAELLQARADELIEPSPFFNTKVMAALRERSLRERSLRERQSDTARTFAAMWKAARGLVASMVVAVAILLGLTLWIGGLSSLPTETAESENIYSAEWVILENGDSSDDLTYSEVMTTLYESAIAYGENK